MAQEQSQPGAGSAGLCRVGAASQRCFQDNLTQSLQEKKPEPSQGFVVCWSPLKGTKCQALSRGWDRCHQLKVFFRNTESIFCVRILWGEKNPSNIFEVFCLKFGGAVKDRKGALMAGREKPLQSILSDSISFNATLSLGKVQAAQPEGEEETCLRWLALFIV